MGKGCRATYSNLGFATAFKIRHAQMLGDVKKMYVLLRFRAADTHDTTRRLIGHVKRLHCTAVLNIRHERNLQRLVWQREDMFCCSLEHPTHTWTKQDTSRLSSCMTWFQLSGVEATAFINTTRGQQFKPRSRKQVRQCWPSTDIPSRTVASLHRVGYGYRVPLPGTRTSFTSLEKFHTHTKCELQNWGHRSWQSGFMCQKVLIFRWGGHTPWQRAHSTKLWPKPSEIQTPKKRKPLAMIHAGEPYQAYQYGSWCSSVIFWTGSQLKNNNRSAYYLSQIYFWHPELLFFSNVILIFQHNSNETHVFLSLFWNKKCHVCVIRNNFMFS